MKAYKVELLIIDHDGIGADGVKNILESQSFSNDCIYPQVMNIETKDIGSWNDEHPLNRHSTYIQEYNKLFHTT